MQPQKRQQMVRDDEWLQKDLPRISCNASFNRVVAFQCQPKASAMGQRKHQSHIKAEDQSCRTGSSGPQNCERQRPVHIPTFA